MTNTLIKKNNTGKYIAIICLAFVYISVFDINNTACIEIICTAVFAVCSIGCDYYIADAFTGYNTFICNSGN